MGRTYAWTRSHLLDTTGALVGQKLLASYATGDTVVRARLDWGATAITETYTDWGAVLGCPYYGGVVTTIGNGTETAPKPYSDPSDVSPPAERWLWLDGRVWRTDAFSQSATGTNSLQVERPAKASDVKAMVLAPTMPAGETLNVWFTWEQDPNYPSGIPVESWMVASVLALV